MSASIGKLILIIFLLLNFFVGTRIISSQAFCPINLRVTERNLDSYFLLIMIIILLIIKIYERFGNDYERPPCNIFGGRYS
jgi:hypothetical protein